MRKLLCLVAALLLLGPALATAAPPFGEPKALLDHAYEPYANGRFPDEPFELYSKRLRGLVNAMFEATPPDEVGPLDFDPFINAQDYTLTGLEIGEPNVDGDRAVALVTFRNFDVPQELLFHLVREKNGWLIDDIESLTPDAAWRLSDILTPERHRCPTIEVTQSCGSGAEPGPH